MTDPLSTPRTAPVWMCFRAIVLWLGASAVRGSLSLAIWYRMTLRRLQGADDEKEVSSTGIYRCRTEIFLTSAQFGLRAQCSNVVDGSYSTEASQVYESGDNNVSHDASVLLGRSPERRQ